MIDDFGPDFDLEGNPLEEGESDRVKYEEERSKPGRTEEQAAKEPTPRSRPRTPRRRSRRRRRSPRRRAHGHPEGSQQPHLRGQERPQDHAGDGDGRGRTAAAGRAAHRRDAPLRAGDPQDDPAGRRGRRGRDRPRRAAAGAREDRARRHPARHRRPWARGRVQHADHPRGPAARSPSTAPTARRRSTRSSAGAATPRSPSAARTSSTPTSASPIARPSPTRARSRAS